MEASICPWLPPIAAPVSNLCNPAGVSPVSTTSPSGLGVKWWREWQPPLAGLFGRNSWWSTKGGTGLSRCTFSGPKPLARGCCSKYGANEGASLSRFVREQLGSTKRSNTVRMIEVWSKGYSFSGRRRVRELLAGPHHGSRLDQGRCHEQRHPCAVASERVALHRPRIILAVVLVLVARLRVRGGRRRHMVENANALVASHQE
mmetsp:Transcript_113291/g.366411  ORF Transcript_113291/g.366411 Transcript_113291/m.366411 type:complete len:203 (-) Transcript_113291:1204-1812(-)